MPETDAAAAAPATFEDVERALGVPLQTLQYPFDMALNAHSAYVLAMYREDATEARRQAAGEERVQAIRGFCAALLISIDARLHASAEAEARARVLPRLYTG